MNRAVINNLTRKTKVGLEREGSEMEGSKSGERSVKGLFTVSA